MSTKKQILYSILVLALAGGGVAYYVAAAAPTRSTGMEGHNHAAMGGGSGDAMNPVQLTDRAARAIGVTFATAKRETLDRSIRTVGAVGYDETRLTHLNPKIEGWVERLHVDFTGAPVERGQPMLDVYSPRLVTAQEELILARRLADEAEGERASRNAAELLDAARRRLAYWDIAESEIAAIEEAGEPRRTLTLRAPAGGVVVAKNVVEGGRIAPGMTVFEIADLSTVWVEGEVFEKDLSLATEGQTARVTFQAYPGEVFEGEITYVYPTVSMESRTGRVRVELENPGLRLRPGMYADITLEVPDHHEGLVVPRTAILHTGERSVAFVHQPDGTLVPREVSTGLVAGDAIEVLAGLDEGQKVVSSASFLIDAESNLGASMAGMEETSGGEAASDHAGHEMDDTSAEPVDGMEPARDGAAHTSHEPAASDNSTDAGAESMDHSGHQ